MEFTLEKFHLTHAKVICISVVSYRNATQFAVNKIIFILAHIKLQHGITQSNTLCQKQQNPSDL